MGKNKKRNAFFYFMVEKKPLIEKKLGRTVTMNEMPDHVTAEWKSLPESQKSRYKAALSGGTTSKLDCRGVPLRELERQAQETRQKVDDMKKEITDTIDMYQSGGAIHLVTLYLVSTSRYVLTDEGHYMPAEISLLHFSLGSGITREFHAIIKPFIPPTYAHSAREHSQATHNLLNEADDEGDTLEEVCHGLKEFLSQDWGKLPRLYTLQAEMEQTEAVLKCITNSDDLFKVYSLDLMFQHMFSATSCAIPLSVSREMITECSLDYHPNIACTWHNMNQMDAGRFCTLSCIRRWVFFMCKHIRLQETFGVVPQEGKHCPVEVPLTGVLVDLASFTLQDKAALQPSVRTPATPSSSTHKEAALPPRRPRGEARWEAGSGPVAASSSGEGWADMRRAGPSKASSVASLFSAPDTYSEQDFPTLGAGAAKKGASRGQLKTLGGGGPGLALE